MTELNKKTILGILSFILSAGLGLSIYVQKLNMSIVLNERHYINSQSIQVVYYEKSTDRTVLVSHETPIRISDAENERDKKQIRFLLENTGRGKIYGIKIIKSEEYNNEQR